ncbi:phosphatidylethanolamine-binding protein [Apiospora marii]|uniref:phosphatidylethanolamine-binding protein n=1 Tax=Apiospora marii TaxID=335849 RepID=UPI0031307319
MFFSKSLLFVSAIGGITQVVGKTPVGFTPATDSDLIVTYGQVATQDGAEVAEDAVTSQPSLATASKLPGSSYAILMVDLDIPVNTDPHTLLHWMQTDLTPATTATTLATGDGKTTSVFELQNTKNTPALADYVSPAPPAKNPLSHRYVQLLVDTSNLGAEGLEALKNATSERVGFDVAATLAAAGLSDDDVVAANSYNVTNPGPAQADELKREVPEMRRMVVRAPEHWDAEWKVRRQDQQQQATKTGESKQLPSTVVKANSTVAVGVFERNGTIIVGVFPGGNKSTPSNGTAPTTVPVVGSAPLTLPSAAGWTTGVVCCILGLMFSL